MTDTANRHVDFFGGAVAYKYAMLFFASRLTRADRS